MYHLHQDGAIASVYPSIPIEVARAIWMKEIVEKHKDWIGFNHVRNNIKALDYCAGTRFFSQVSMTVCCMLKQISLETL